MPVKHGIWRLPSSPHVVLADNLNNAACMAFIAVGTEHEEGERDDEANKKDF